MTQKRQYKYFDFIMAIFVTVLLCANIIGPAKLWSIGDFVFGAGILFFPISYLFGDILTEVYGYAKARRVVWTGFGALIFASFMSWTVLKLPAADGWEHQEAYELVLGSTPRIAIASMIAYFVGEFCNSYVLAKMKVKMKGKHLWMRTIGSTIVGEGVDSIIFYPLAFYGLWPTELLLMATLSNYALKVLWEVLATPFTYKIVAFLKKAENEDYYDRKTNFTPFKID